MHPTLIVKQYSQLCGNSVCPSGILGAYAQVVKVQLCLPMYEGLVHLATYLQQG